EAELLKHEDTVQARELICAVVAIAGLRIGLPRLEQADLVIEAQLPRRHARDPREISDLEHGVLAPPLGAYLLEHRSTEAHGFGHRTFGAQGLLEGREREHAINERGEARIALSVQVEPCVVEGHQIGRHSDVGHAELAAYQVITSRETV